MNDEFQLLVLTYMFYSVFMSDIASGHVGRELPASGKVLFVALLLGIPVLFVVKVGMMMVV